MTKVSVLSCENYELEKLVPIIKESLNNIIDCEKIFTKGKKVFLKVNSVSSQSYELGFITHPKFLQAVIKVLKEYPVEIIVGDNPPIKEQTSILKSNGLLEIINEEKVAICKNTDLTTITNQHPLNYSTFTVSKEMVEADIMINLPKLKTHSFTYFSGAQKNLFGLIYGLDKAGWHARANDPLRFGTMINDLYLSIKQQFKENPLIHLFDAIDVLEGDGPTTGGTKRHLGLVLASTSGVSIDRIAHEVTGLKPDKSFILKVAREHHIEEGTLKKIEIVGESLDSCPKVTLKEPEKSIGKLKILEWQWVKNLLLEHPVINNDKCLSCGECSKICPPQTMKIEKGKYPKLNRKTCIRCWCCSEVCPVNAISKSKRPILGRIVFSKQK